MTDDFFDDEQELMEAEVSAASSDTDMVEQEATAAKNSKTSNQKATADPAKAGERARVDAPPFWMALAIAAIALILGVVIGYMIGTSATLAQLGDASEQAAQEQLSGDATSSQQLPEGHPQLSVDQDGNATVVGSTSSSSDSSSANASKE